MWIRVHFESMLLLWSIFFLIGKTSEKLALDWRKMWGVGKEEIQGNHGKFKHKSLSVDRSSYWEKKLQEVNENMHFSIRFVHSDFTFSIQFIACLLFEI